ncbi:hypothetical protein [Aquiflexum sp.]|uniref:hypothetical protein n=1 Tax=Aquiflexum sp. TaxID=1872584 RepID=UPI0035937105
MDTYKLRLLDACSAVAKARNELFTAMINVGMSGEFRELDELFEEGDFFQFEKSHFQDCKDINLGMLMELIEKLDETHSKLVNLNAI